MYIQLSDYEEPVYYPSQITTKKIKISNEAEKETGYFNVYPNPATDFVQVSWKITGNTEVAGINIYNIQSHNVYSLNLKGQENTIIIPVKDFSPGVYTCTINFMNGIKKTKKFTVFR
jgi:hypothetical protein